jgi:hypothetical protein
MDVDNESEGGVEWGGVHKQDIDTDEDEEPKTESKPTAVEMPATSPLVVTPKFPTPPL